MTEKRISVSIAPVIYLRRGSPAATGVRGTPLDHPLTCPGLRAPGAG
jgi:hypothetical protein